MAKNILGFIVGFLVAGTVVGIVEGIGHAVYPPPAGMDPNDPESIRAYMAEIPFGAMLFVVGAWIIGTGAGAYAATRIAKTAPRATAFAVGALMLLTSVYMMIIIPSPLWFKITATVGVPLASAVPSLRARPLPQPKTGA